MQKLDPAVAAKLAELAILMGSQHQDLGEVVEAFRASLEPRLKAMNDTREEALALVEHAHMLAETHMKSRSAVWRDSDAGAAYELWERRLDGLASELLDEVEGPDLRLNVLPDYLETMVAPAILEPANG